MSDDAEAVFCEAAAEWDHAWVPVDLANSNGVQVCTECGVRSP